jgi:hypothetical protein
MCREKLGDKSEADIEVSLQRAYSSIYDQLQRYKKEHGGGTQRKRRKSSSE